jgi:hypothetical protein
MWVRFTGIIVEIFDPYIFISQQESGAAGMRRKISDEDERCIYIYLCTGTWMHTKVVSMLSIRI